MNSTQMRDAIAKALGMNPADIQIVDVGVNDADQAVPAPSTWAQSNNDLKIARQRFDSAISDANEIEMLHHKLMTLQVENKELTRRNDRQCATINELHEKLAGGEELADKKARRKSLLQSVLLAQALMSDIFDEHDALVDNETFPEDVLGSINTELDLLGQRLYNLGQYVTRNL